MATLRYFRLGANLTYLTLLFAVMLWVYVRLTHFDGLLRLEPGASENIAYLPATSAGLSLISRQALPAEVIPFEVESTRLHLGREEKYVPRSLPFSLYLAKPNPHDAPPLRDELVSVDIRQPKLLQAGIAVQLDTQQVQVLGFGPWQGLAASPRGSRCAAFVLTTPENTLGDTLRIEAERWLPVDAQLAIGLRWHDTEAEARAAAEKQARPGIEAAWWTVQEGSGVIRSTSFLPGSGTECSDGSVYTIEELKQGGPEDPTGTLVIRAEEGGTSRLLEIAANTPSANSRVRFHHPGRAHTLVALHAWREDSALAALLRGTEGASRTVQEATPGSAIEVGEGRSLWVSQLLPYAVPVTPGDTPVQQVVLATEGGQRYYLREGGMLDLGGKRYSYRRVAPSDTRPLVLTVSDEAGQGVAHTLDTAGEVAAGAWRIARANVPASTHDTAGVYLRMRYEPFPLDRILGLALFMGGAYGFVFLRFRPRLAAARQAVPPGDGS